MKLTLSRAAPCAAAAVFLAALTTPVLAAGSQTMSSVEKTAETNATLLAAAIISRWEPVAVAAGHDASVWHEQFTTQLKLMSARGLQRLADVAVDANASAASNDQRFAQAFRSSMLTAYVESTSSNGDTKLASTTADQVFIPITPCRVVDTRNIGGPVVAGFPRNFNFYASTGTYNWASQGGASGNASATCPGTVNPNGGAPSAAVATVTVVGPTAAGNFIAWGGASPAPTTSVLNWSNPGDVAANTTVIPAGGRTGTGPGGTIEDFAIAYNGPTGQGQVIVDVVGYFVENQTTPLDCMYLDRAGTGTNDWPIDTTVTIPAFACPTGYTKTGLGCSSTLNPDVTLNESSPNRYTDCVWENYTATTRSSNMLHAETVCCRVPGQ